MGSPRCEYSRGLYSEEEIQVTLTHDFEIQQTELTRAAWASLAATPETSGCDEETCPVANVSWEDAAIFANLLSDAHQPPLEKCYSPSGCTGELGSTTTCAKVEQVHASVYDCPGYRLPTDAEWEYAARAGTRTSFYLGPIVRRAALLACEDEPFLAPAAWYCFNSGRQLHPVGQRLPNGWGLFDMLGNIEERTSDGYDDRREYAAVALTDPGQRITTSQSVARRGGHVVSFTSGPTAAKRLGDSTTTRSPLVGFRLVRTLPSPDGGK